MYSPILPHQEDAIEFIKAKRRGCVALEMGLGKTRVVLQAARELGLGPGGIIVLCPKTAVGVWGIELKKWWPYDYENGRESVLNVVSYSRLAERLESLLERRFELLIIDESHRLKNPETKLAGMALANGGLASCCERVWMVTGTPAPNTWADVWLPLYWGGVTALGRMEFEDYFFKVDKIKFWAKRGKAKAKEYIERRIGGILPHRREEFGKVFEHFFYYRKGADVYKDFPGVVDETVVVKSKELAWAEYFPELFVGDESAFDKVVDFEKEIAAEAMAIGDGNVEGLASATPTLRKQMGLMKVVGCIGDIRGRLGNEGLDKIVVFAWHLDVIELLRRGLGDFGVCVVVGSTSSGARDRAMRDFQGGGDKRVFIGQIRAAGESITLTKASTLAFVEKSWVPGHNLQASFRVRRVGQVASAVHIISYALDDDYDRYIENSIVKKEKALEFVLGLNA